MLDPYHNAFRNLIDLFDLGSPRSSSKVYEGVTSNAMKWYLAIMSVVVTLLGMASVMPAALSVMVFDAPGSTSNPATIALFIAVASCPFVCMGAVVGAWALYAASHSKLSAIVIWAPALNLAAAAIAFFCLDTFYDGKFNG